MMNIVEIDYTDLCGQIFNGYELHQALQKRGMNAIQIVKWKESNLNTVRMYADDRVMDCQIRELEERYSVQNLLFPYAEVLQNMEDFKKADIVHYHLVHKGAFSILDIPALMKQKKSVWTIHDPWIITGNCVHPLECTQWKVGCRECRQLDDGYFRMNSDNAAFMWSVKQKVLSQINPDVVVASDFMKRYIQESPLTRHFHKIHKIPFGVDITKYHLGKRELYRRKLNIPQDKFVLAFRSENARVKGCKYLYEALREIGEDTDIVLLCVGEGSVPDDIKERYHLLYFGWVESTSQVAEILGASDLFVMPSLAESFGLMAVEAMAAGCMVLCFEETAVAEITEAPDCGSAVSYRNAGEMAKEIITLKKNRKLVRERGRKGHELVKTKYRFDEYVNRHVRLYEELANDDK